MDYKKYYKKTKVEQRKHDVEQDITIDSKESTVIDKSIYTMLLIALLIIPIFIKAHLSEFVSPSLTFISTGIQADIFSYYKYVFLVILTILIAILFLYKVVFLQYNLSKNTVNLILAVLAVMIVLSAVFSPYKSIALHGMYNRHEGTFTYICYLIIFFVAANTKFSHKQIRGFLYTLYPFVLINMFLGLSLFNEKNPLDIGWINNFILSSVPEEAQVNAGATLWSTLSNPNYISGISGVLAVLFLTWAIFDKNKIRSAVNVVVAILSFVTVLTSISSNGFLTILALMPVIIVLLLINTNKVKSIIMLAAFLVLSTAVYIPMVKENSLVWNETFGFIMKENPFAEKQESMSNNENHQLPVANVNDSIITEGHNPAEFGIAKGLTNIFLPSKVYAQEEQSIKFEIPTLPESGYSAGSGRGYIWSKSFETAMERPLIGYGLDTFIYVFPQNDIEKIAGLRTYDIIVDKPHNLYLALLIGSGIFALVAFVLLAAAVLWKGATSIWKQRNATSENAITLALFSAVLAYLVQGIANDSVVGSAVIFWILLGILVSITNLKKETK